MPHFDEYGGDEWICQLCTCIFNSRVNSTWFTPVPGKRIDGNVCPTCAAKYSDPVKFPRRVESSEVYEHGVDKDCLRCWLEAEEPLNRLDYADDPAEYDLQCELRRLGVKNTEPPTLCPECSRPLESHRGMAYEPVLVCSIHGIVWEDVEGAIRNVY